MSDKDNRVAAVTGAASGIGRALALELAGRGVGLAVADINERGVEETAALARQQGVTATATVLDVSERAAVIDWAEGVMTEFGAVDLLFNNAGVAQSGSVAGNGFDDYDWVMGINFWGVVNGTKASLPLMREAGRGHIVNIASIFGVFAQPGMSTYNASKFAVRGFTESLRQELDILGGAISATCVIPGGIRTGIAHSARMSPSLAEIHGGPVDTDQIRDDFLNRLARTTPEQAARTILSGVERNARRVLVGADAKLLDLMQRLMPSAYQRLVTAAMRREAARARRARQAPG